MTSRAWIASFAACIEVALAALLPARASACAGDSPDIADETTFDPGVLGDSTWEGLYYDPYSEGYGGACADCERKEQLADWSAWLGGAASAADWEAILLHAGLSDIDGLIFKLQKKAKEAPPSFRASSILKAEGDGRARAIAALYLVGFARRVEPLSSLAEAAGPDAAALERGGDAALARAKDPFLKQRYAFLLMRLRFYRGDWPSAAAFYQANAAVLDGPSESLRFRARYYLAGALKRAGQLGRANLELARIHARFPALSGAAARDFQPAEEKDWQETLRLAANAREKAELWRLVGLKSDGLAAAREILALDPASDLVALLAVRELARVESQGKSLGGLEALALQQASAKGADRPWLFDLLAGHIAALQGKLPAARAHLEAARKARPGDARVAAQAQASLALALARSWKPDRALEDELALAVVGLNKDFARRESVVRGARQALAKRCVAAGRPLDAELFVAGSGAARWGDPDYVRALIQRAAAAATPFERFEVQGSGQTLAGLQRELASALVLKGDFAAAAQLFKAAGAASSPLKTDPFVIHVRDCHDCDHEEYANAPWTHASAAARLAELERKAQGQGAAAAEAALELGNGLYNLTWYGNARRFLEETHSATRDTRPAEKWYRRAFELAANREVKAKAAFLAAKCELAQLLEAKPPSDADDKLPAPEKWFSAMASLQDTSYHREVVGECGNYRDWMGHASGARGKKR